MFLHPALLIFAGGMVIPVVLHLLSRSRQVSITWGAMMFLDDTSPRTSLLRKLRSRVVLLLRCLALGALAVALARPVIGGGWRTSGLVSPGLARASVVIVVDTSGSTGTPAAAGTTRLDAVKEAASRVLASLSPDDLVVLLFPDSREVGPFTTDRTALNARIGALRSTDTALNVAASLERAARILAGQGTTSKVIAVVSDRQAASYNSVDSAFEARWVGLRKSSGVTRVVFVPTGETDADNVSIRGVEVLNSPILRGRSAEFRITVRNDGTTPRANYPVRLLAPGLPVVETFVNLAPNSTATCRASLTFVTAGRTVVTAENAPAGAGFDDHRDFAVDISDQLKVMVVTGEGRPENSATAIALAPFAPTTGPAGSGLAENTAAVTFAGPGRIPVYGLGEQNVIVIPQLQRLTEGELLALTQFVYAGGGLVLGTGPLTDETTLHRLSALLPAEVGVATPPDAPPIAVRGLTHPITAYASGADSVLPGVTVRRRRLLSVKRNAEVVLATPADGKPDAVWAEGKFGAGTVLLSGVPLEGAWTDMTRSVGFLPLVQSAVRYVAGGGESSPGNFGAGAYLVVSLPGTTDPRSIVLSAPQGFRATPTIERQGRRVEVRWGPAVSPGVYEVLYRAEGKTMTMPVVVTPVESESDLSASPTEIERAGRIVNANILQARSGGTAALVGVRYGRELWPWMLGAAIGCLLLEQFLVRVWIPR